MRIERVMAKVIAIEAIKGMRDLETAQRIDEAKVPIYITVL